MKNFLLGVFTFCLLSFSAISTDIMTIKPATPKHILVKSFPNEYSSQNVADFIKTNCIQGWILKSVEGANYGQTPSTWIVVMEKY